MHRVIRKGFVKLFLENEGEVTIISIAKPGTFIGVQALYGESVYPFSAEAMTDTEICNNGKSRVFQGRY